MSTPTATKTYASRLLTREQSSRRTCPLGTRTSSIDEGDCIFPKRFSRSRDVYFTTNSRGEVVEIADPKKQFNSMPKKSLKNNPAKPVVELTETRQHPTKEYRSISANASSLLDTVNSMVNSRKNKCLERSSAGVFLERYKQRAKRPSRLSPFCAVPSSKKKLSQAVRFTVCHMYSRTEWPRVRSIIMDVISSYGLEALLKDSSVGYRQAFTNHGERYTWTDTLMSYLVMSLCHIDLFNNPIHASIFYESLEESKQKTKLILDFVDECYKYYLSTSVNPAGINGHRTLVLKALPDCVVPRSLKSLKNKTCIRRYTHRLPIHYDSEGNSYPWFTNAKDRLRKKHKAVFDQFAALEAELEYAEYLFKDGDGDYEVFNLALQNVEEAYERPRYFVGPGDFSC